MLQKTTHTHLIILVDPDKYNPELIKIANTCNVSYIFVGGSVLKTSSFQTTIKSIKRFTKIPVIIFPGDETQVSKKADGILVLSLLSGRNAEYLIGKIVKASTAIKASKLHTIPTGYILIDGKKKSATQKVTKTKPLSNYEEVINTAIAAELLGKQLIYLEAGSGAKQSIQEKLIKGVKKHSSLPLIVGGGINGVDAVKKMIKVRPDYIVIGNALETAPNLLLEISYLFNSKH